MPLQATSGAASYDAFGGGVPVVPNYIEECFSCFLHTGTGSAQTITNGIDLSTKGGLVWIKGRNNSWSHILQDTNRGVNSSLTTNNTEKAVDSTGIYVTSFNSNGFSIGPNGPVNFNTNTYVSWAFRKQPKFYTQGTYTGTGSVQNITHDLGSIPAFIIVKDTTNDGSAWAIYHTSLGNTKFLQFTTDAAGTSSGYWNNTSPTSTQFTVGTNGNVNQSGATFVYYAFAHDAGGFGLTGTDNVISCGSFDGTANTDVALGYEPQWIMFKNTTSASNWQIVDNMRGMFVGSADKQLMANLSNAESDNNLVSPTATGFTWIPSAAGNTYIYIAIRRGPMKVPTSGTSVFIPVSATPSGATTVTTNFPVDLAINAQRDSGTSGNKVFWDRLRGSSTSAGQGIFSNLTNAEVSYSGNGIGLQSNTTIVDNFWNTLNGATTPVIYWNFKRAPSFFDEVCYTGTGSALNVTHNLSAVPSFLIVKRRNTTGGWIALHQEGYAGSWGFRRLDNDTSFLNTVSYPTYFGDGSSFVAPTSTQFTVGSNADLNASGGTYVAYLFATCAGVSKVGSYTGTGATQTISCGFTGGARFVLIKRTDSTGNWYVWDTARGMVSGTDPYLLLNSTAAEVNTNSVYTTTDGFQIVSTASGINASGGSYIFLAIA